MRTKFRVGIGNTLKAKDGSVCGVSPFDFFSGRPAHDAQVYVLTDYSATS